MNGNEKSQVIDTLLYRDCYMSLFFDDEKYLAIFVNDRGLTKVLSTDDNFYSVEDDIIAYRDLIAHSSADTDEQKEYLRAFINYTQKELDKANQTLNWEWLESRGIYEDD